MTLTQAKEVMQAAYVRTIAFNNWWERRKSRLNGAEWEAYCLTIEKYNRVLTENNVSERLQVRFQNKAQQTVGRIYNPRGGK